MIGAWDSFKQSLASQEDEEEKKRKGISNDTFDTWQRYKAEINDGEIYQPTAKLQKQIAKEIKDGNKYKDDDSWKQNAGIWGDKALKEQGIDLNAEMQRANAESYLKNSKMYNDKLDIDANINMANGGFERRTSNMGDFRDSATVGGTGSRGGMVNRNADAVIDYYDGKIEDNKKSSSVVSAENFFKQYGTEAQEVASAYLEAQRKGQLTVADEAGAKLLELMGGNKQAYNYALNYAAELYNNEKNPRTLTPTEALEYSDAMLKKAYREYDGLEGLMEERNKLYAESNNLRQNTAKNNNTNAAMAMANEKDKELKAVEDKIRQLTGWNDSDYEKYMDYANRLSNKSEMDKIKAQSDINPNATGWQKTWQGAKNTAKSLTGDVFGVNNMYASYKNITNDSVNRSYMGVDTNSRENWTPNRVAEQQADTANAIDSKAGKFIYNTAYSAADSLIKRLPSMALSGAGIPSVVAEVVGLLPYFGMSYNSAYQEARDRGATDEQAVTSATFAGAIEVASELVPVGNVIANKQGKNVAKNVVKTILKQMAEEGLEESVGGAANEIVDNMLFGNDDYVSSIGQQRYQEAHYDENGKERSEFDTWKDIVLGYVSDRAEEFASGALSTLPSSGFSLYSGNKNAKAMMESQSAYAQDIADSVIGDTEYEKSVKDTHETYAKNPVQAFADSMEGKTEESKTRRENLQKLADKVANGEQLSVMENNYISQAVSEEISDNKKNKGSVETNNANVPNEYRTAITNMSTTEAEDKMLEAANKGDLEALSEAYNQAKSSRSAETRNMADEILNSPLVKGQLESKGISTQQIESATVSTEEAYKAGYSNKAMSNLSEKAQIAYNEGKIKYETEQRTSVGIESELAQKKVNDLTDSEKAVYKANMKPDTNAKQYNMAWDRFYNAGETNLDFEKELTNGTNKFLTKVFDKDTLKSFYDAGVQARQNQLSREASKNLNSKLGVKRASGIFEDARTNKSDSIDYSAYSFLAKVIGQDVVLANFDSGHFIEGENAHYDTKNSKIYINADENTSAGFHEALGEFMEFYNAEGFEVLRDSLNKSASSVLGASKYNEILDSYKTAYANAGESSTGIEMSREMTNDLLVAMMGTQKGREALASTLTMNTDVSKAKDIVSKIKEIFDKITESIKSIISNSHLTEFQEKMLNDGAKQLEDNVDLFIKEFNKAVENSKKNETKSMDKEIDELLDSIKEYEEDNEYSINIDNGDYSYDTLIKKPNLEISSFEKYGLKDLVYNDSLTREYVRDIARENIEKYNKEKGRSDLGNNVLYNRDIDGNILINSRTFNHYKRRITKAQVEARLALPLYLENAIVMNETTSVRNNADKAYIMFGIYDAGDTYKVARLIVNHYSNGHYDMEMDDVLYGMTVKKEEVAPLMDASIRITPLDTSSNLTVTQLLYAVKRSYPNELPLEISRKLDYKRGNSELGKMKYSINVDSTGKKLTENQSKFFEDSKVVDENGRLKVMYHGTEANFNVFDIKQAKASSLYGRGFYFSNSPSHASTYGDTKEVYLNIVNPVQPKDKNISKDQLLKFINAVANDEDMGIDNYGYGATPKSVLDSVWGKDDFSMLQDINSTCIGDFASAVKLFNRINGTNYDGIIAPTETVAFYANQIKLTTNENPTSNDDIRYSIKVKDIEDNANVEVKGNLIAVHNMTPEQLMADIELKGLPSPSIAIIKAGMGHSKYGTVSLVFKKDTIDPKNSKNKVYGGDAWTPTFPRTEVKLNDSKIWDIDSKISKLVSQDEERMLGYLNIDPSNLEDRANSYGGDFADIYRDKQSMRLAFLRDADSKYELPYKATVKEFVSREGHPVDVLEFAAKELENKFKEYAENRFLAKTIYEGDHQIARDIMDAVNKAYRELYNLNADFYGDEINLSFKPDIIKLSRTFYDAEKVVNGYEAEEVSEFDRAKFDSDFEKAGGEQAYENWINDLFEGVVEKKGLRNNKDIFLPSGKRRSWDALHEDYTLDNIVKLMNQMDSKGADGFFAEAAFQAIATKDFKSIAEMHKNENMLGAVSEEEYEALKNEHREKLLAIAEEIKNTRNSNSFMAVESAIESINDAIKGGKTLAAIQRGLNREAEWINLKEDTAQKVYDLLQEVSNMPTGYFEAKPRRAVWLDEISYAILPNNVSQDLLDKLNDNNIEYKLYAAGNEAEREAILNERKDVRFSMNVDKVSPLDLASEFVDLASELDDYGYLDATDFGSLEGDEINKFADDIAKGNTKYMIDTLDEIIYDDEYDKKIIAKAEKLKAKIERGISSKRALKYSINPDEIDFLSMTEEDIDRHLEESGFPAYYRDLEKARAFEKVAPKETVRQIADKLRKEFGSTYNLKTLTDNLQKFFAYANENPGMSYNDFNEIMDSIARPFVSAITEKANPEEYKRLTDYLKGMGTIKLTSKQIEEVQHIFGSVKKYRNMMMPISNISTNVNGKGLDTIWSELCDQFPGLIPDVGEGEMPGMLYDTLQALRSPRSVYKGSEEEVAKDVTMRILEEYLGGEQGRKIAERNKAYKEKIKTEYDKKYEKLKNQKYADILARNKKAAERAKEKEDIYKRKQNIWKNAKNLHEWASKPTKQKHIPREMVSPVMEMLSAFDFVQPSITEHDDGTFSTRVYVFDGIDEDNNRKFHFETLRDKNRAELIKKYNEMLEDPAKGFGSKSARTWKDRMRSIKSMFDAIEKSDQFEDTPMAEFVQRLSPELAARLDDLLKRDARSINNLNAEDVRTLDNVLRNIVAAVNQGNKAYTSGDIDLQSAGNDIIEQGNNAKERRNIPGVLEGIKDTLDIDMLTPRTAFSLLGETGDKLYKLLRKGLNTKIADTKKAADFMEKIKKDLDLNDKEISEWGGKKGLIREFNLKDGVVRLTDLQIMALYETFKQPGMYERARGGIKVKPIERKAGMKLKQNKAYHLNESDVKAITDTLTEKQKKFADELQKYMAVECAKDGNKVSMSMYGYEMFVNPSYFPLEVDRDTVQANDKNLDNAKLTGIRNSGFTNVRNEKATNPIMIGDILDIFTNHVAQMADYHGYATSTTDILRWFNYKQVVDNENQKNYSTVKSALNAVMRSDRGADYFKQLLLDINGAIDRNSVANYIDYFSSAFKASSVLANASVVIQQPFAYARAANMIDPKYMIFNNPVKAIKNIKYVNEVSPIAWWKAQGYYETNIGRSLKEIITGQGSVRDKINEYAGWAAGKADDITWALLYQAVENEQRDMLKGQPLSKEEFRKRVNERFDDMIDQTQVVDSTLHRSQYMRSQRDLHKLQTAFMAEPTKSYNMLAEAILKDVRSGDKNFKRTGRAIASWAVASIMTAAAKSLVGAMRHTGDDDEYGEVYLEQLKANVLDNLDPIQMIPWVKDIESAIKSLISGESTYGQSSSRYDLDGIKELIQSVQKVEKYIQGDSKLTPYGVAMAVASPLSKVLGIPIYAATRDLTAMYNMFFDDIRTSVEGNNDKLNKLVTDVEKGKGESKIAEDVAKVLEGGKSIKEIRAKAKTEYNKGQEEGDEEAYNVASALLMATGMTLEEAQAEIESWDGDSSKDYSDLDKLIKANDDGLEDEVTALLDEYGKDPDKVMEHIMNNFTSSVEYEREHNLDTGYEDAVTRALEVIDPTYTYDSVKADMEKKAQEKAEKAKETEEANKLKQDLFDAIDTSNGTGARNAINSMVKAGKDAKSIKGYISTEYHERWKNATSSAEKSKIKQQWINATTLANNILNVTNAKDPQKVWADWEADQK